MRKKATAILGALLIGCALPTIHTTAAAAADCSTDLNNQGFIYLTDSSATWDIRPDGGIDEGYLVPPPRSDGYDAFPIFGIDDGTNGREQYTNPDFPDWTCTYEADGRQLAFPTYTTLGGLEMSRKVYVPPVGQGFARFYDQVHNPGAGPATITLYTADGSSFDAGLGSDFDTTVEDSSAGSGVAFVNDELDTSVSWFTTSDESDSPTADPVLAHNLDAPFARTVHDRVDSVVREGGNPGNLNFVYEDVTVPAGGTVAYLSFEAMRPTAADAGVAARFIDAHPAALFTGLSDAELASVQNWDATDFDGDGVANAADNCPSVSNPDQANTDGGSSGDACDSDIDGDGIPNDVETAFGTNPFKADTDGDGVNDNADNCPKVAGAGAGGCQAATVPTVVVNNVRRASTTELKVTQSKTAPVKIRTKGTVTGSGTPGPQDCTHGLAQVIVKVSGLTVSNRVVRLTTDCTFKSKVTLDQPRRLVKKVVVKGKFLGSDGLLPSQKKVKLT